MNKESEDIEMKYGHILFFLLLSILCSTLIISPLALSQDIGDREENRQEMEILQEMTRLVTGIRFLEENRDLSLHQEQAKEILPLLATIVDEGMVYRARALRIEVLEILCHYVDEEGSGSINQELERRVMENHGDGVVGSREGDGEQVGRQDDREEMSLQGSLKREEQVFLGGRILEDLQKILSSAQLRWIENLPLSSLIGVQVSRGRGQGAVTQESGDLLMLFEELVEWFLWEKVSY